MWCGASAFAEDKLQIKALTAANFSTLFYPSNSNSGNPFTTFSVS